MNIGGGRGGGGELVQIVRQKQTRNKKRKIANIETNNSKVDRTLFYLQHSKVTTMAVVHNWSTRMKASFNLCSALFRLSKNVLVILKCIGP